MTESISFSSLISACVAAANMANAHFRAAAEKCSSDPHYRIFREECAKLSLASALVGTATLVEALEQLNVECPPFWL